MKKLLLILVSLLVCTSLSAGTLQKKMKGFFDSSTTINNNINTSKDKSEKVADQTGATESVWNVNFFGLEANFPDQPANQQVVPTLTGLGVTYKFAQHAHIWTRYSTFQVEGVELNRVKTKWAHQHIVGGYGLRFSLKDKKQFVANFGVGQSSVEETVKFGSVGDLKTALVTDLKYLWMVDNISFGLNLSIVEAASKANTWELYHKGGYMSIGLTLEFGVPNLSGFKL